MASGIASAAIATMAYKATVEVFESTSTQEQTTTSHGSLWIPSRWPAEKTAYNSFSVVNLLSQCLFVSFPPLSLINNSQVTRQRLGKHVPAATTTHTTITELLNASFSVIKGKYVYNRNANLH
jgi:hypothetical protein